MPRTDEFERSVNYGEAALTYLKGNRAPAHPRNYELWYTYAAGLNRDLNQAVNDALKRLGHLPAEMTERLYDEFLSPVRISDRAGEVSSRVAGELDQIIGLLESTGQSVAEYGTTLRSAAESLGGATGQLQLRALVDRLIAATIEIERRNARIEAQIRDSRTQIVNLQESLEAIRYESLIDQMTGLANRKHFDQSLDRAIEAGTRRGEPLSLILCDIDHFKTFNDRYGHQTGDQVLRLVGAAIRSTIKGRDIAARYGGEEFAIILPNTRLEAAVTVANQIRAAVMAKELIKRSSGESLGRITMSGGVALFDPTETRESFVERADACLYMSKRNGRNRVTDETELPRDTRAIAVA